MIKLFCWVYKKNKVGKVVKNLLPLILILFVASCSGDSFEVQTPNCPFSMSLEAPYEYRPPKNYEQQEIHDILLGTLNADKSRRAQYTSMFMKNWDLINFNFISVGTPEELLQHQGKISRYNWFSYKKELLKLSNSKASTEERMHKMVLEEQEASSISYETPKTEFIGSYSNDDFSVVVISNVLTVNKTEDGNQIQIDYVSAGKWVYVDSCIVFLSIIEDRNFINVKNFMALVDKVNMDKNSF